MILGTPDVVGRATRKEAGEPMKQKHIGFRDLLERLLPIEELPPVDRMRVQRALRSGVSNEVEQAAMHAIDLLEQQGALRRLPVEAQAGSATVRYQPRDRHDIITLQMPGPRQHDGVIIQARSALPTQAPARLDQVRRLIRLDDPLIFSDPRTGTTRAGLHTQLEQAGRELLGSAHVAYFAREGDDERTDDRPLDPSLVADVVEHHGMVFYCPNVEKSASLSASSRDLGVRSVALVAVTDSEGRPIGHLEVRNAEVEPYLPSDLAMIALLADYCGGVLERATRIEKLVFVDPHTGVYNRSYYDLQIRNEIARATRDDSSLALLIVDIDDFKSFNTSFGFEAGNQVLVQVAQTLRAGVRPFDTVARWGGEEFAVLLTPPVVQDDVLAISERLRSSVERTPMRLEGLDGRAHRVHVTVCVGVAMFPDHAETPQDLWRAANAALLLAKRPPKNQVVFHRPKGEAKLNLH
jgi:diguanylate cyclase (GGDEF)-like protein